MLDERKRIRAEKLDDRTTREALKFIRPFFRQMASWHTRTAYLTGMGQAMHARDLRRPQLLDEARALSHAVDAARVSFEKEAAALPQQIASSSRVLDTKRSLDSVSECLARAISLIDR